MARKNKDAEGGQPAKKTGILTNPIRNLSATAALCLILGVAFLAEPYFVRDYCGYVIGGLLCLIGLVYLIAYFLRKPVSGIYRSEFAAGTVMMAAGVYVIVASLRPDATGISITLRLIVTVLGVFMAADGVLKLQYTLDLARMRFDSWWLGLFTSFLGLALGSLTAAGLVDDFGVRINISADDYLSATLILGVAFLVNAVLDIVTLTLVAVRNHAAAKAETAAPAEEETVSAPVQTPAPAAPYYAPAAPAAPVAPVTPAAPVSPAAPQAPAGGEQP